jgi:hypothetical protein
VERRTLLLIALLATSVHAEPALTATDEHAIDLALRAIKMTEHDLAFSKTNVE